MVAAFTQPTARPLTMAADEEVTKMKEQLKRAMLLCQQSNKQVLLPENLSGDSPNWAAGGSGES